MSIHTTIASNINDYGTLIAVLNESGIAWQPTQATGKVTGEACAHAVNAVIGQETVLIWQEHAGEAFRFQSAGWTFRNAHNVRRIATTELESVRQRREQLELLSRQDDERRREEERRRSEEAERQRRIEEERRQALFAAEASQLLGRLDAAFRKPASPPVGSANPQQPAPAQAGKSQSRSRLEELVGRLHQQSARQMILDHAEEMGDKGFSLEGEEVLEDQTIVLRFRG